MLYSIQIPYEINIGVHYKRDFHFLLFHSIIPFISGFLQIQIIVNFLLTSSYQPSLTKFSEDVTYFSKLILAFLPQITNEILSDIRFVVVKISLDTCKYITHFPYPLRKISTSIGFPYLYHKDIPNVQHVGSRGR